MTQFVAHLVQFLGMSPFWWCSLQVAKLLVGRFFRPQGAFWLKNVSLCFDFLSQRHNKLCKFISDIMGYWMANTSHKPISLTARLAVNPTL